MKNNDCPYCEGHIYIDPSGNSPLKCTECYRSPEPFVGLTAADVRKIVTKVLDEREDERREQEERA